MRAPDNDELRRVVAHLGDGLRDNLVSCSLYGSTARGNAIAGVSDLNLLIVLRTSSAEAHAAIARTVAQHPRVEPLVVEERQLARTARCFAAKFASIKRHHRVLWGSDPLAAVEIERHLERLLCEQSVRNLRLRLAYAFMRRAGTDGYSRFLGGCVPVIFVNLAEILRLEGVDVPGDFSARLPLLRRAWPAGGATLDELLELRGNPRSLSGSEALVCHQRVLDLLDAALDTIESRWKDLLPPCQ